MVGAGGGLLVVLVVVLVVDDVLVEVDEVVLAVVGSVGDAGALVTGALVPVTGGVVEMLVGAALLGAALDDTVPSAVGCDEHPASAVRPATTPTTVRVPRLRIRTA